MTRESVEDLHRISSSLKAVNEHREDWLKSYDAEAEHADAEHVHISGLPVTREEAETIFTARRTAIEAKLKELGWSKTTRVDSNANGDPK